MKHYLLIILAILFISGCGGGGGSSGNPSAKNIQPQPPTLTLRTIIATPTQPPSVSATYRVTFAANWTPVRFSTNFPPGPHFSPLIGATHNEKVIFWQTGTPASLGIERMAESGSTSPLSSEIGTAINSGTAQFLLRDSRLSSGTSRISFEFNIEQSHSTVTLVSMIAPSPDWFVGVSDVNLFAGGKWAETATRNLRLYDAGTDAGTRFTSLNSDNNEFISRLTSAPADTDFLSGVHRNDSNRFVATFVFQRLQR